MFPYEQCSLGHLVKLVRIASEPAVHGFRPLRRRSAEKRVPTHAVHRHGVALIGLQVLPTEGLR